MRRRGVGPRSHPASLYVRGPSARGPGARGTAPGGDPLEPPLETRRTCRGIAPWPWNLSPRAGARSLAVASGYSVLLNSAMAIAIMTRPMTATMPRDSQSGTTQPPHVMLGANLELIAALSAGDTFRWLKTTWRIGPTT